jgi:hypothetical protein
MTFAPPHHDDYERTGRRTGLALALAAALLFILGPSTLVVARAIANLPVTAGAVVWAKAHGGECTVVGDLTIECSGMHGGYTNAATTVGNVWLYGELGGTARHRHEAHHSDQWAMFSGGPTFPVLYSVEYLRTGGDFRRNVFERWAGLADGGYGH